MKKVYISGPITGIEDYKQNFGKAADMIWDMKPEFRAVNPVALTHNHDKSYESYMKEDIKALLDCDSIYMLEGWEKSKGATFELEVAKMCGIPRLEIL